MSEQMNETPVDMAKVTQMLDAGWVVQIKRGQLRHEGVSGYVARAHHGNVSAWTRAKNSVLAQTIRANTGPDGMDEQTLRELNDHDFDTVGEIDTEDFTPGQALTRLAYKVLGEII